ncbi:hypothetical protein JGU66_21365 [Myxococcaceae bacterium JPH2]|nr:hypothetical protein [Myxococcaceae bacterium JPH2]
MLGGVSFEDALRDNRVPRTVGDVTLRYDEARLVGEARPAPWVHLLPAFCVALAAGCTLGALTQFVRGQSLPGLGALALAVLAAALLGFALQLESRLGRRRFVLHFRTETLRLETLTWAPGGTRAETVAFDDVRAVRIVERSGRGYALVVEYGPEARPRSAVLVQHARPAEAEALHRVWRMLHNAFGLRGAGLAGG